jgi:hypothetical protein
MRRYTFIAIAGLLACRHEEPNIGSIAKTLEAIDAICALEPTDLDVYARGTTPLTCVLRPQFEIHRPHCQVNLAAATVGKTTQDISIHCDGVRAPITTAALNEVLLRLGFPIDDTTRTRVLRDDEPSRSLDVMHQHAGLYFGFTRSWEPQFQFGDIRIHLGIAASRDDQNIRHDGENGFPMQVRDLPQVE